MLTQSLVDGLVENRPDVRFRPAKIDFRLRHQLRHRLQTDTRAKQITNFGCASFTPANSNSTSSVGRHRPRAGDELRWRSPRRTACSRPGRLLRFALSTGQPYFIFLGDRVRGVAGCHRFVLEPAEVSAKRTKALIRHRWQLLGLSLTRFEAMLRGRNPRSEHSPNDALSRQGRRQKRCRSLDQGMIMGLIG